MRACANKFCLYLTSGIFIFVSINSVSWAEPISIRTTQILVQNADSAEKNSSTPFANISGHAGKKAEIKKIAESNPSEEKEEKSRFKSAMWVLTALVIGGLLLRVL